MSRTLWLWASSLVIVAGVFSTRGGASVHLPPPVLVEVRPNPPVVNLPVLIVLHHPLIDVRAGRIQWRFAGQSEWQSLPGYQLHLPPVSETPLHLQFRVIDTYGRASPVTELVRTPVPPYPRVWVIRTEPTPDPIYGQPFRIHPLGQSPLLRKVRLEWRLPGQTTWQSVPTAGISLDAVNSLNVRIELRGVDETGLASPPSLHAWSTNPLMRSYPVAQLAGLRYSLALHAVAVVPGTKFVLFGGENGLFGLLDLDSGDVQLLPGHDPEKPVWDVAAVRTAPGQLLGLSAGQDGKAFIWDLQNRKIRERLTGHKGSVNAVAFSPDGQSAFTCGEDGVCIMWDVETEKLLGNFKVSAQPLRTIRTWIDNQYLLLAIGAADKQLHIWNANTGTVLLSQPVHSVKIGALAAHTNRVIATGGDPGVVSIWLFAPAGFMLLPLTPGATLYFPFFAYHPLTRLYNLTSSGGPDNRFADVSVTALDFTPDGQYVLACDLAGRLTMWNLMTGRITRTLTQPDPSVYQHNLGFSDMALTPDGNFAVTADREGYIRVWFVGERP